MTSSAGKSPTESEVQMTQIVLPSHTNALGTIFGGTIVSWIDIAGAIAAGKHARKVVVTASIDALAFIAPVRTGNVVHIKARVNYASRTSMEVGVRVTAEDTQTGETWHTSTAYLTFVALDGRGKPAPVPPILPQTEEDKRRYREAQKRREARIALAKSLKENDSKS